MNMLSIILSNVVDQSTAYLLVTEADFLAMQAEGYDVTVVSPNEVATLNKVGISFQEYTYVQGVETIESTATDSDLPF